MPRSAGRIGNTIRRCRPGAASEISNLKSQIESQSENRKPQTENPQNEVFDFFYPGSVLVTSRDIITLWVAEWC
jgi:hypothetical protein